ncbi:MAG: glycosyltransferase family 4 protein [Bdellovibrionales bacterium]|nr:glycosyltransferase family 4 protein [Bdellovibrionales bacterium]
MSSPKRVCVLTSSFPRFEGDEASVFVGRLVQAFSEVGLSGVVVCPVDQDEPLSERQGSFGISRFRYGLFTRGCLAYGQGILTNIKTHPLRIFQIPFFLYQLFYQGWKRRNDWDIIHANWIVCGIPAYVLSRMTGKPYYVTLRGVDMKLLRVPLLRRLLSFFLNRASHIVSVNFAFLTELQHSRLCRTDRLTCIPNGASVESFTDEEKLRFLRERILSLDKQYILFVSRVIPLKRVEILIEALANLENQNTELLLVGRFQEDYRAKLEELARKLDCLSRVRFEGAVGAKEIALYHSVATLYASASSWEGRSNSVAEALVAGTPVVVSEIPGHSELVENGIDGVLVSEETTEAYAAAFGELLHDADRRKRYAKAGKEKMKEFTWKAAAERYCELFSADTGG